MVLPTGDYPIKWKISNIILIPKSMDWNYDLKNARPILLLECVRKLTLKILGSRIMKILKENNILISPNYCGLKQESMDTPIYILNNLMKDVRDQQKEQWLLF